MLFTHARHTRMQTHQCPTGVRLFMYMYTSRSPLISDTIVVRWALLRQFGSAVLIDCSKIERTTFKKKFCHQCNVFLVRYGDFETSGHHQRTPETFHVLSFLAYSSLLTQATRKAKTHEWRAHRYILERHHECHMLRNHRHEQKKKKKKSSNQIPSHVAAVDRLKQRCDKPQPTTEYCTDKQMDHNNGGSINSSHHPLSIIPQHQANPFCCISATPRTEI